MKLTTIKVNRTTVRTKKEKINFLLKKRILKKKWKEVFLDEETGEVVICKRKFDPTFINHPILNRMIFGSFKNAQKL